MHPPSARALPRVAVMAPLASTRATRGPQDARRQLRNGRCSRGLCARRNEPVRGVPALLRMRETGARSRQLIRPRRQLRHLTMPIQV